MVRKAVNITIEPSLLEEFERYASREGIRISPWVAAKMRNFIEEEKAKEQLKKNQK